MNNSFTSLNRRRLFANGSILSVAILVNGSLLRVCDAQPQYVSTPSAAFVPNNALVSLGTVILASKLKFSPVTLIANPGNIFPDAGKTPLPINPNIDQIINTYNMVLFKCNDVNVIAPRIMTVINTVLPAEVDIWSGLDSASALKVLVANLSDSQWRAITSERGIGMNDLDTDLQRKLFLMVFPNGKLKVYPASSKEVPLSAVQDWSDHIPSGRLRIVMRNHIGIPVLGHPNYEMNMLNTQNSDASGYKLYTDFTEFSSNIPGSNAPSTVTITNQLKPSDLDYNTFALQVDVPLGNIKTVKDLISKIQHLTKVEIYSDKHFEDDSLLFLGSESSAKASDLLKALAYSLTGTFRRVNATFIFTDDLLGIGSRLQRLDDFRRHALFLQNSALEQVGLTISRRYSPSDLKAIGDPLALSPAEVNLVNPGNAYSGEDAALSIPFSQLTLAQKDYVNSMASRYRADPSHSTYNGNLLGVPDISGRIGMYSHPTLQYIDPSIIDPIDMTSVALNLNLFQVPSVLRTHLEQSVPSDVDIHSLSDTLKAFPDRAIMASPISKLEVTCLVQFMQMKGFNQLWIPVVASSKIVKTDASKLEPLEILDEALKACHGTEIRVFAVTDFARKTGLVPVQALDRTLFGDTSSEADKRKLRQQQEVNEPAAVERNPSSSTGSVVSLMDEHIKTSLIRLSRQLFRMSDLRGIVFTNVTSEGYRGVTDEIFTTSTAFGYNNEIRLEYIRKYHTDPIDIYYHYQLPHLNNFYKSYVSSSEAESFAEWAQFRLKIKNDFLNEVVVNFKTGAAPVLKSPSGAWTATAHTPIIYLDQQVEPLSVSFFTSWDNQQHPPFAYINPRLKAGGEDLDQDPFVQAKTASRHVLVTFIPTTLSDKSLALAVTQFMSDKRNVGVVLDLTAGTISHQQVIDACTP